MTRFSPSATETWLECPLKRHLSHAGWTPRKIGKREMGAILGGAFAQGVNAWKSTELAGQTADPEVCAEIAAGSAQAHCADLERAGAIIQEWDRAQYQAITRRASEGVRRIIAQDPIPPTWNLLDVERVIPEWGGCRIDLGLESPLGVIVWDWKCKLSLDAKWLPKEVEKYRLSEQRWHYSCAYGDFLQRPVSAFYIGLVILEPFRVHVLPYVNDPVDLVMWQQAREQTWADMATEARGERQVGIAAKHHNEYGPCEFQRACWEYHLDADLMAKDFIQREGSP